MAALSVHRDCHIMHLIGGKGGSVEWEEIGNDDVRGGFCLQRLTIIHLLLEVILSSALLVVTHHAN